VEKFWLYDFLVGIAKVPFCGHLRARKANSPGLTADCDGESRRLKRTLRMAVQPDFLAAHTLSKAAITKSERNEKLIGVESRAAKKVEAPGRGDKGLLVLGDLFSIGIGHEEGKEGLPILK